MSLIHSQLPTIRAARPDDVDELVHLLCAHVPHVAPDTVWHIPWAWQHFHVVSIGGQLIGAGSLQPLGDGRAEIRGVVVDDTHRGSGIASLIIDHLLDCAARRSLTAVCVTRKPGFFRRFGFEETLPSWLDLRRRPHEADRSQPKCAQHPRVTMALRAAPTTRGAAC